MDPGEHLALAKAMPDGDESWLSPGWLSGSHVSPSDRSCLVDWIIQVTDYIEMTDVTLHLAVAIMDRVLQKVDFNSDELQLLGVASLLVAAKVEEDEFPGQACLLKMAGDVYTRADLTRLEMEVVLALDWRIRKTTAPEFLYIYKENVGTGRKVVFRLARAILDMALTQEWCGSVQPSKLATSCLMAASFMLGQGWPEELVACTGYRVGQLFGHVTPCLKLVGRDMGDGVKEKHAKVLDKLEDSMTEEKVKGVIKEYISVHVRTHKDSTRSCG